MYNSLKGLFIEFTRGVHGTKIQCIYNSLKGLFTEFTSGVHGTVSSQVLLFTFKNTKLKSFENSESPIICMDVYLFIIRYIGYI